MLMVIRKVLGAKNAEVDDTLQESMLGLLKALPDFRGESSVPHFARRVALFTAMAARRRMRVRETEPLETPDGEPLGDTAMPSPFSEAVRQRRMRALCGLLTELPSKLSDVLASHFVLGNSVEEMAVALAIPENTVWSRLRLGKEALRKRIAKDRRLTELLELSE